MRLCVENFEPDASIWKTLAFDLKKDTTVLMSIEERTQQLIEAAGRGDRSEVQRLIPLSNPSANRNAALENAAKHGHLECLNVLLAACDVSAYMDEVFYKAAFGGNMDCVRSLLPYIDIHARASYALISAASGGSVPVVEFLLPYAVPTFLDSRALLAAVKRQNHGCVQTLIPVSNVDSVISQIGRDNHEAAEQLRSFKEKVLLTDAIHNPNPLGSPKRKM